MGGTTNSTQYKPISLGKGTEQSYIILGPLLLGHPGGRPIKECSSLWWWPGHSLRLGMSNSSNLALGTGNECFDVWYLMMKEDEKGWKRIKEDKRKWKRMKEDERGWNSTQENKRRWEGMKDNERGSKRMIKDERGWKRIKWDKRERGGWKRMEED